ncbi:MAG: hypothetical protein ACF8PG_10445 [Maioricimonas sp. JB045]
MDARYLKTAAFLAAALIPSLADAAQYSTRNFVVTAPTEKVARAVAECAEYHRRELALLWIGKELDNWYRPCTVEVKVGNIGAGGATTFTFDRGEVFGWKMNVQGTLERILDSVIPHEVSHTIFACHFRRPLPRWADEGAATLVEHESERMRQTKLLNQIIRTSRRIPLKRLLGMKEYPREMQQVLTLYAEGYSLASYLVQQKGDDGRSVYLQFLQDAEKRGWEYAIRHHYGYKSIDSLEDQWLDWVMAGSPSIDLPDGQMLASAESARPASQQQTTGDDGTGNDDLVIRSQSPGDLQPLPMLKREIRTASSNSVEAPAIRPSAQQSTRRRAEAGQPPATSSSAPHDRGLAGAAPSFQPGEPDALDQSPANWARLPNSRNDSRSF